MDDSLRTDSRPGQGGGAPEPALAGQSMRPLFLVGMMGAGKTTIGRALAKALGRRFVDLDLTLEARCGVTVAHIFEVEGEAGFRRRETQLLDECSREQGLVVATGGGAMVAEANRRCVRERGTTIYLRASADELYQRVARDRHRPLLQTDNPRERLGELLQQREPYYEEVADITFDTGQSPVGQVVERLLALLAQHETTT